MDHEGKIKMRAWMRTLNRIDLILGTSRLMRVHLHRTWHFKSHYQFIHFSMWSEMKASFSDCLAIKLMKTLAT